MAKSAAKKGIDRPIFNIGISPSGHLGQYSRRMGDHRGHTPAATAFPNSFGHLVALESEQRTAVSAL